MKNKAVFWDLLGTLGDTSHTLLDEFTFFEKAIPALNRLQEKGWLNIIVTNQSHIAHGRLSLETYEAGIRKIHKQLAHKGIELTAVYMCPHKRSDQCKCKKPQPTMVLEAIEKFNIDVSKSFLIGDTVINDIELAHKVNMKGILILTEDEERNKREIDKVKCKAIIVPIISNPLAAVQVILNEKMI